MLTKQIEEYKVSTETEARTMIDDFIAKSMQEDFEIGKNGYVHKVKRSRKKENYGEIEEEWWIVTQEAKYGE